MATYQSNILPVNGSNMWVQTPYSKPLPPVSRRMPGRPSIKRRRHISENEDKYSRVSSRGRTVTCRNCLQNGHNMRSCKNQKVTPAPKPKKKMGRPRLNPEMTHWTTSGRGIRGGARGGRAGRGENVPQEAAGNVRQEAAENVPQNDATIPQEAAENVPQNDATIPQEAAENVPVDEDVESDTHTSDLELEDVAEDITGLINDMRESKYTDLNIMDSLGLTESEFKKFADGHVPEFKVVDTQVPESQPIEEDFAGDDTGDDTEEEGIEDTQDRVKKLTPRKRKPSERIQKVKLKSVVVQKDGRGSSADKALDLD